MGWLIFSWLWGCRGPCPPNSIRVAGRCQLVAAGGVSGPLTEAEFVDRYDRERCDALEECACESFDTGDCEIEVDCDDTDWPDGCTFDGEAARDCVNGRFDCDVDGEGIEIEPPLACASVYTCGVSTGDTAAR